MTDSTPTASESRKQIGRVAFARAELRQPSVEHEDLAAALRASLIPGTQEVRYRKAWRLGQVTSDGGELYGRLGFTREEPTVTDLWDPDATDFVESEFPTGAVSPFVVRLSDGTIAFQLRGNDIDVGSFTYALEAILRRASLLAWTVAPLKHQIAFDDWAKDVSVTALNIVVRRPNPNYKDRPNVQEFIEGPGAAQAEARWRAADGEELDIGDALIQEFLEHAARRSYGRVHARGVRDGREVRYDEDGETRTQTVSVNADTGEVGNGVLVSVLESDDASTADET